VVVACRNEARHIRQLLSCLQAQDRTGLLLDAILADGVSTDGTRVVLDEYAYGRSDVRVLANPKRIAAAGLNLAIKQATGEFIVRMDAHTEYAPDYVASCIRVALHTGAANVGGAARTCADSFWQRAIAAGFHSSFATGGASFRQANYTGPADTVPYGCWRRDLLLRLGLFDESLVRNQDDELNFRIQRIGGMVWQDESILSYYRPRSTLGALFRQYFQYGLWKVAVLRKHRVVASLRQLVPVGAFMAGVSLLLALVVDALLQLSPLLKLSATLLLTLVAIYVILSACFGIIAARRNGWNLLPVLPLVFATYQLGYASGYAAGLLFGNRSAKVWQP
jgi:glycosyltransferase involved in cell wall biosynthesis